MSEIDVPRLSRIDELLKNQCYDELEAVTVQEMEHALLSDTTINTARRMQLPSTVIYLASLGVENLRQHEKHQIWLAVYQSIGRHAETEAFQQLNGRSLLKLAATALIHGQAMDKDALKKCKFNTDDWHAAIELVIDHRRFELLEFIVAELIRRKTDTQAWLNITRILFNRHRFFARTEPTESLGNCYVRIRECLVSTLYSVVKVRSKLALYASHCYFRSRNYAATILHAQKATTPEDRLVATVDVAKAYCHAGDLPHSIEWLDKLIAAVPTTDLSAPQEETVELDEPRRKPKFDAEQASVALVDLQATLAPMGQRAFLVSGTLLGYAREGQLLSHDKDIDVGIIGWEQQFDVVNALVQSGHFGIDFSHVNGRKTYHIPVLHLQTGISIDVFIYHLEDGHLVTGVESYFGYLQKFAFTPFELKAVQFLGADFYVPGDVDRNLTENFGNWRASDPGYISHLESPSTVDVGGLVYQIVGRLRALEAIQAKNIDKLSRSVELLDRYRERPSGASEATLQILRGFLKTHSAEAVPC